MNYLYAIRFEDDLYEEMVTKTKPMRQLSVTISPKDTGIPTSYSFNEEWNLL